MEAGVNWSEAASRIFQVLRDRSEGLATLVQILQVLKDAELVGIHLFNWFQVAPQDLHILHSSGPHTCCLFHSISVIRSILIKNCESWNLNEIKHKFSKHIFKQNDAVNVSLTFTFLVCCCCCTIFLIFPKLVLTLDNAVFCWPFSFLRPSLGARKGCWFSWSIRLEAMTNWIKSGFSVNQYYLLVLYDEKRILRSLLSVEMK